MTKQRKERRNNDQRVYGRCKGRKECRNEGKGTRNERETRNERMAFDGPIGYP